MSDPSIFPRRPRVAIPCACRLGEGPVWDDRTGTLFFVDVKGNTVFRWRPEEGGDPRRYDVGDMVGFALPSQDPERVVVGLRSGLATLDLGKGALSFIVRPDGEPSGNRLNDASVGADGSIYFGTMDDAETEPTGTFYRWSGAQPRAFGGKAVVTNGPAVDTARGLLYTTHTQAGTIFRHAIGPDGEPGAGEVFRQFGEGEGHPDGAAVDADGHLWVAHFGGSRVTRFAPDGAPVLEIPMPTAKVTKVCFGGPDLSTLYITTASIGQDRETDLLAGHVFVVDVGIRGVAAVPCRIPA